MRRARGRPRLVAGGLCAAALLMSAQAPPRDPLPRRGWFGVALALHDAGAAVTAVVEGSSAAAAGIRAGDVIQAVDGRATRIPEEVVAAIARHGGGDSAVVDVAREGRAQRQSVRLRPFPTETIPGVTFEYGSVVLADGSRLRTIVSVPDGRVGARLPAVMLLQGGSCGSIDSPMAPDVGPSGLIRTIAARGHVTMRVEKSGIGDSQGPPCSTIGYHEELAGYRSALAALARHPSVDPDRIHLLGVSLGGVFAPVLAGERRVRGIVVYGTLAGPPSAYPGRSERFFREFAPVDVAGAWSRVDTRVLALRGEFDGVTSAADHARIAALVNDRRPGSAVHRELEGLDHCWTRHASMDESRGRCGQGAIVPALSEVVLSFLASP